MKRIVVLLFALAAVLPLTAQQRMVRLTRYEGQRITGVQASSAFDVYLEKSDQTRAVVEIDEELEERLNMTLSDGTVKISLNSGSSRSGRSRKPVMKLILYLPEISSIKGSGATTIYANGDFTSQQTTVTLSGASELKSLNLDTEYLIVEASGASDLNLSGRAGQVKCSAGGASDVDLNVICGVGTFSCTGASEMALTGEAGQATMTTAGGSSLKAESFAVKRLTITASSASDAKVWAVNEIRAKASSASSVRYRGNPSSFSTEATSASSIKKID